MGKPEESRPLERPRRRWDDNIKVDLREGERGTWPGSILLWVVTGGGLLYTR